MKTQKKVSGGYIEVSWTLPRLQAREVARRYYDRYPNKGYDTQISHWHVTKDGQIHFVMKRLATCD